MCRVRILGGMAEIVQRHERDQARKLYWQGYSVTEVANELDIPRPTVESWRKRDKWDNAPVSVKVADCIETRLAQLIAMPKKSDAHLKEMDTLTRMLERTCRMGKYEKTGNEADLNPKVANRNSKQKKKRDKEKNFLSDEHIQALREDFEKSLFKYQKVWGRARDDHRIRNILKSRQIGATWYFAREAFLDAVENGDNQIFLSASKAQAHVFREYIVQWVKDVCDVTLRGDPMHLPNGATLYFLGTSSRTAQSYHGHVYMDEYFWIPRFKEFKKVTSGMAAHKKWTQTYFSTPSTVGHEAYPFWAGTHLNKGRKEDEKVEIDTSHDALQDGCLCEDGVWRHIVTIEDAEKGGCDLFDLAALKLEYSDEEFANLFMCVFVDDHVSYFKLKELEACMVDSLPIWTDFNPYANDNRPYGDRPVWIGYDPSRYRDDASIVVLAPPHGKHKKYRILEKQVFRNTDFEKQAEAINDLCDRYNVQHIGIDKSGIGQAVYDMVKKFFSRVSGVSYSVEVKNRLVLKLKQIITRKELQFDCGMTDLVMALMSIRQTGTASGRQTTFQAHRTSETGHADSAWALMHAVEHEEIAPIAGQSTKNSEAIVEIM